MAEQPTEPDLAYIAEGLRPLAVRTADLAFHPDNPRVHSAEHVADIAASLRVNGQVKNILASTRTSPPVVVAGNGTLRAALSLNWQHIACLCRPMSLAQEHQLLAIDNELAAHPEYDKDILDGLMRDIDTGNDERLNAMLAGLRLNVGLGVAAGVDGQTDADAIPEPPDEAITQPGDLWVLGNHRLLCGDSSKAADVDRLLDGAVIHLCNTDPPYNVRQMYSEAA